MILNLNKIEIQISDFVVNSGIGENVIKLYLVKYIYYTDHAEVNYKCFS